MKNVLAATHPDTAAFDQIEQARNVLLNPDTKAAYDKGFKRLKFNEYFNHREFYKFRPF